MPVAGLQTPWLEGSYSLGQGRSRHRPPDPKMDSTGGKKFQKDAQLSRRLLGQSEHAWCTDLLQRQIKLTPQASAHRSPTGAVSKACGFSWRTWLRERNKD